MPSQIYPKLLVALWQAKIDLSQASIRAAIIDATDRAYNADDEYLADLNPSQIIALSPPLTGKTFGVIAPGVFDAADTVATSVSGDSAEATVLYADTGDPATSRLITWLDASNVLSPDGGNVDIRFPPTGILTI